MTMSSKGVQNCCSSLIRRDDKDVLEGADILSISHFFLFRYPRQIRRMSLSKAEIESVEQLSRKLHGNCDQILDHTIPFNINSKLLWNILELLQGIIADPDKVSHTDDSISSHLLFLWDFLQQTPSLAVSLSPERVNSILNTLDLSIFSSLQSLELWKIPITMTTGMGSLRKNLKKIKCMRCLDSIEEILSRNEESVWPSLIEVDFSFNRITRIPASSFDLTPNVEILNLSRNEITNIDDGIFKISISLTELNLSYNKLNALPFIPPNLRILRLAHNHISSLELKTTLGALNLQIFDLTANMIDEVATLTNLKKLHCLKKLYLRENPLCFMDHYRTTAVSFLSKIVIKKDFTLDEKPLSFWEIKTSLKKMSHLCQEPIRILEDGPMGNSRLGTLKSLTQSFDSNSSSVRSSCRKKPKIREILFSDEEASDSEKKEIRRRSSQPSLMQRKSPPAQVDSENSARTFESIRQKFGEDNWLQKMGAQVLEKKLKIPPSIPKPIFLAASFEADERAKAFEQMNSRDSTFYSLNLPNESMASSSTSTSKVENEEENSEGLLFYSCYPNSETNTSSIISITDDPDCDNEVFKGNGMEIEFKTFLNGKPMKLVVEENFLYDIEPEDVESYQNKIIAKWDLKSIESLIEVKVNKEAEIVEFRLIFDTLKKDMREKVFWMNSRDFNKFEQVVNPFLEERTMKEFSDAYQCVKCSAQFSKGMAGVRLISEGKSLREVPCCPNQDCQSELLVLLSSMPLPNNESISFNDTFVNKDLVRTSTPLSASMPRWTRGKSNKDDESKLFASSLTNNNIFNFHNFAKNSDQIPVPIAMEANALTNANPNSKSDSDIEVISTDSSSIEVLPKSSSDSSPHDVDVLEAVELEEEVNKSFGQSGNSQIKMSESSSSASDSVITVFEKNSIRSHHSASASSSSSTLVGSGPYLSHSPRNAQFIHESRVPIKYDYENFSNIDHRLRLFADFQVFKSRNEELVSIVKVMIIADAGIFNAIVIFSNRKIYFYKIIGREGDSPENWLKKLDAFHLHKLTRLDVLIGRHGIGLEFSTKYFAVIFRDSQRTSNFLELFLGPICENLESPPIVRDFSHTHKALMSPNDPISYFGILRYVNCDALKPYTTPAVVLTNLEIILVVNLNWLGGKSESAIAKHVQSLSNLRQIECLEKDDKFIRLLFQPEEVDEFFWEFHFETNSEKEIFLTNLQNSSKNVPLINLSQPLEP